MSKLKTPLWGKLDDVYEPREDSFFLLDTLEDELSTILFKKPSLVVEIGSGSGIIVAALAGALGSTATCIAVDINPKACIATAETASLNSAKNYIDVLRGDLVTMFNARNQVDILIFNPPYVVTHDDEIAGGIERSWAGGTNGTQVLNRLLPQLKNILSINGVGYFVLIEENHPDDISEKLEADGIYSEVIARKKIPGEKLCILKFYKKTLS